MSEITINATRSQIEDFISSVLWKDMIRELSMWKAGFRREMASIVDNAADTNPSSASVLMHLGDINGRIKAVDYMLGLPEMFLQVLKAKGEDNG